MSISDIAHKLSMSYQESAIHMSSWHISLRVLQRYAKLFNSSFISMAHQYGYSHQSIQHTLNDPFKTLHDFLRNLRKNHHFSQIFVAKRLGVRQTTVSRIERSGQPSLLTIIHLARLYHMDPINILTVCPKYHKIQHNSPAHKLIRLMAKHNLSVKSLTKVSDVNQTAIERILSDKIHKNDRITLMDTNKLQLTFHLPANYFGPAENTVMEGFKQYEATSGMSPYSFGYRYNKLRCKHRLTFSDVGDLLGVSRTRAASFARMTHPSPYIINSVLRLFPKHYTYLTESIYSSQANI